MTDEETSGEPVVGLPTDLPAEASAQAGAPAQAGDQEPVVIQDSNALETLPSPVAESETVTTEAEPIDVNQGKTAPAELEVGQSETAQPQVPTAQNGQNEPFAAKREPLRSV